MALERKLKDVQDLRYREKKEYERMEQELMEQYCQKLKEANARADEIANKYAKDNAAAVRALWEAEDYKEKQRWLYHNQQTAVDRLAEKKIEVVVGRIKEEEDEFKRKCKSHYESKYIAKEMSHVTIFTFCVLWSIL